LLNQRDIKTNETVLSGDVGIENYDGDNTPRVISITGATVDSSTTIDGFTVTKAHYRKLAGFDYTNGGIFISWRESLRQKL